MLVRTFPEAVARQSYVETCDCDLSRSGSSVRHAQSRRRPFDIRTLSRRGHEQREFRIVLLNPKEVANVPDRRGIYQELQVYTVQRVEDSDQLMEQIRESKYSQPLAC